MSRRLRRPHAHTPPTPRPGASLPGDLLLAKDPATPPEVLRLLCERYVGSVRPDSTRPQAQVLRAVAKNPNAPPEVLRALAAHYPHQVLQNQAILLADFAEAGANLGVCRRCGESTGPCWACAGQGKVPEHDYDEDGAHVDRIVTCDECEGRGRACPCSKEAR